MYGYFDGFYSDAVFAVLASGEDSSRRLGRAIDWLDLAWRNSPSISPELRVVLLRTGFEMMFGSDNTYVVRDALCALLDSEDVTREEQTWTTLGGNEQTAQLSDLGWWFMQFAFLRNAIMHGDEVPDTRFEHNGRPQVWLGESRLRAAIKARVAEAGFPTVLLDRPERERQDRTKRMNQLVSERLEADDLETDDRSE
jgi:hypothetical protein